MTVTIQGLTQRLIYLIASADEVNRKILWSMSVQRMSQKVIDGFKPNYDWSRLGKEKKTDENVKK